MRQHAPRQLAARILLVSLLLPIASANNLFGVSDTGVLTRVINASRAARTIASRTAGVVDFLHAADAAAVCGDNPRSRIRLVYDGREKLRTRWYETLSHQAENVYGLHIHPQAACARQVSHNVSIIRVVMNDLTDLVEKMNISARPIANAVRLSNWSHPLAYLWTSYRTDGIMCNLAGFSAVRRSTVGRPRWYLKVGITNEPETLYLPDWQRQYVMEHIHATRTPSGPVLNFPAHVPAFRHQDPRGSRVQNMTTLFAMYGGKPNPSQFYTATENDIVAFRDAQLMGEKQVDLASEDVLPSNTIILIMPIVMNFIPISAVAEVGTLGTLVYVLCTDIMTSVPLAIKGVELIHVASRVHIAANSWIIGHPTLGDAISEHWLASCRSDDRFRRIGIMFLFFAIFTMVLGIVLEIVVVKINARRRVNASSGAATVDHRWLMKSGCDNCQCHIPYYPASAVANGQHDVLEENMSLFRSLSGWWPLWTKFWSQRRRSHAYEEGYSP